MERRGGFGVLARPVSLIGARVGPWELKDTSHSYWSGPGPAPFTQGRGRPGQLAIYKQEELKR